jgi:hypothetical protein
VSGGLIDDVDEIVAIAKRANQGGGKQSRILAFVRPMIGKTKSYLARKSGQALQGRIDVSDRASIDADFIGHEQRLTSRASDPKAK